MFDLDGDLLSEALADARPAYFNAGPVGLTFPQKYPRTPEREALIRTTGASVLQPFITTAMLGEMASREKETKEKWAYRGAALQSLQSLFTDPTKWEVIAGCIWPPATL